MVSSHGLQRVLSARSRKLLMPVIVTADINILLNILGRSARTGDPLVLFAQTSEI
jgi:hypothetical protein